MCQKMLHTQKKQVSQVAFPVNRLNFQKGFSLIELILVVTIIGIISAVGVPSLLKARTAAQDNSTASILRTLSTLQMNFFSTNGRYARMSELNSMKGNTLGTNGTDSLIRGNFTYKCSPNPAPTDAELKTTYTIIATRTTDGTNPAFVMQVDQSGKLTQIFP